MEIRSGAPRRHEETHRILSVYGRLPDAGRLVTILTRTPDGAETFISMKDDEARKLAGELLRVADTDRYAPIGLWNA